ncbi:4-(cytidine 5'-diphospho)-2-C-methyl-D-erythritol kinase [Peptostreptococcus faecalis]|uniref:4-(cytidine 5'-diphospho)-2-C-methyl-D-erythritol kinase n=1 Tax=Peptostreptococcus faecalis TaxID=2045015 RepID=UPI000C7CDA03|nr:4-(cytidine 5'-diphospho)-2-C-methyl-D-erythritol kinase [Peptostreptococcus faecalis]
MERVKLRARAKINLSIDIKDILEDGYHEVEMVMQSINLSDYIIIRKAETGFKMTSSNSDVPSNKKNIMYKTWILMKEEFGIDGGIEIFLEKNIPIAAGMAGGSADSAAVFIGINRLFGLNLSDDELIELSKKLGSDIAFCIKGGTYLASGKGTDLKKLNNFNWDIVMLICKPNIFVSTKRVYKKYDKMYESISTDQRPDNEKIIEGLQLEDYELMVEGMNNVLEPVTKSWYREIDKIEKTMIKGGAIKSMMSGSGPTVFGFFKDYKSAKRCGNILRKRYSQTYITHASNKGVEICGNK